MSSTLQSTSSPALNVTVKFNKKSDERISKRELETRGRKTNDAEETFLSIYLLPIPLSTIPSFTLPYNNILRLFA